ncbi:MAG: Ig-like domain-containing protein, partial [Planctomycetaceae bacterium]|nr:Ig-like domain-containing protein [Planctomycetaceae bacterium]
GVTSLTNTRGDQFLRATGSGSVLSLPNLTTISNGTGNEWDFYLEALQGGKLDLGAVTEIIEPNSGDVRNRSVQVKAEGVNSAVDLSSLQNFVDVYAFETSGFGEYSRLHATQGGTISLGAVLNARGVYIPVDATSSLYGGTLIVSTSSLLTGQGDIFASVNNSGGTIVITPGETGLNIHGDYTQSSTGKLVVAVDDAVDTESYSRLVVDSGASLAGTLEIARANNYEPDLLTDYALITAEVVSGTFDTVTGGTISGGDLTPQYGSSVVALSRSFDRTPVATFTYQNTIPNQRTFFNVSQVVDGRATFRIYDPDGNLVGLSNATPANPDGGDFGSFLLNDIGTYEIRVYGALGENPTFVAAPNAAPLTTQPGYFRKSTNGDINLPGSKQVWEFDTRAGDVISLDVLNIIGAEQQLSFTLRDPDGRTVINRTATAEEFNNADFGPVFARIDGTYTLTVEGIGDDTASYQFLLTGPQAPRVSSHALKGPDAATVYEAWFLFDQAMDTSSFTLAADVLTFQNPSGDLTATGFRWENPTTLVISFASQPSDVPLFMVLASTLLNESGVALDQDGDRIPGEETDDQYQAELVVDNQGPFVIYTQPGTTASAPIDRVTFHFNEPIDANTFSLADVTQFTGPGGVDLIGQLTSVLVADKSATVFFTEQAAGGQFTISIGPDIADAAGNLMDQSRDGANGQVDDVFTLSTNVQSPDLVVASVTDPTPATHGEDITLTWTVQNNGADPATGTWWDYVYLSANDNWDLNDTLVGRVLYTGPELSPNGGSYQGTLTAPLPGVLPGDYHVIVRTNILQSLTEASLSNNTGDSPATASFDIPSLESGNAVSRNVDYREELYYKFEVPSDMASGSLVVRFGTNDTTVANELYISRDALPTRMTHDARSQQGLASNHYIILSSLQAGTYNILAAVTPDQQVQPNTPLGTASLQADLLVPGEFSVVDSFFGQGGTAGNRTIEINGVNFDRSIEVTLTNGTNNVAEAISYYRVGPEKLYATFNLTSVIPGQYDVMLSNAAGQDVVLTGAFDVLQGGGSSNKPSVTAPPAFRRVFHEPLVHFPFTVSWENAGLNDALTPVLQIVSSEPFAADLQDALNGSSQFSETFYGSIGADSPPGILFPGQYESLTYHTVPLGCLKKL